MNEERIEKLLKEADRAAGEPNELSAGFADVVRYRAGRKKFVYYKLVPVAAAAMVVLVAGYISLFRLADVTVPPSNGYEQIAALQEQIRVLEEKTDMMLLVAARVAEHQDSLDRLAVLEAKLASFEDPRVRIEKGVDKAAFTLLYQADRMYRELELMESAVETYNRVIKMFPENKWADVARQRLQEIDKSNTNDTILEGDVI